MDKTLCIDAHLEGAKATLCVNGMVLGLVGDGLPLRMAVHEYLCRGENRIQLVLPDGVRLKQACAFSVQIRLHKDRGADVLVQSDLVYSVDNTVTPRQVLHKGRLMDVRMDLPVRFPAWHFLSLLDTPAASADFNRLEHYCNQLLAWVEEKNLDALLPQFSARNRELALAYGFDAQLGAQRFGAAWARCLAQHTLSTASADPDQWRFHSIRGSCVYHASLIDHSPLLQFRSNRRDERFEMPLHLAVVNSDVFVVR